MDLRGLWEYAFNFVKDGGANLDYWRTLPKPSEVVDEFFLSELAWCVYNAGMKESVIRQKWPELSSAFFYFDIDTLSQPDNKETILIQVLKVFNHKGKASAVLAAADKVKQEGPIGKILSALNEIEALTYFKSYPYIGDVAKYHIARNVGFDVVKPDRHLVRITEFLDYESPDKLVREIANITGERKGFIDYILWQWLAWQGKDAYIVAKEFKGKVFING